MAAVSIICPSCHRRIKGQTEHLGRKIRCPGCQESFVAAADADDAAPLAFAEDDAPAKPANSTSVKAAKPKAPTAKESKPPAPVDESRYGMEVLETKARCPNCAELMVDDTAIICIHCGYNTLTRAYGKTKKVFAASAAEILQHQLPAILCSGVFFVLVLIVLFYNTVVPPWYNGTRFDWVVGEAPRMWSAMVIVGVLWWLGFMAFRTFAIHPLPEEVEKE